MSEVREGYKMTELGEIPNEWKVVRLGSLANIHRGASPRPIKDPKWFSDKSTHGWIRISDVTKSKKYLYETEQYLSEDGINKSRVVAPGDLIMSICGTIGRPIILKIDACIHDGFVAFESLKEDIIDTEYLRYYLLTLIEYFKSQGQPGTQVNLNTSIVEKALIALPSLTEQQKIALILSTVDEQIDETEQLIVKTKELKKGLMQQLLTKGIGHTEFKQTELGEIPLEWSVYKLEEIVSVLDGKRKPIKKNDRKSGDIPYYGATGIIDWVDDYIFDEELILVGEDGENLRTRVLPMAFKISGKSWVNNHAHVLKPNQSVNLDYLTFYLESINYEDYITGSAQPKLNQAQLKKIMTLVPTLKEQKKIASILSTVDEQIEVYEQEKAKYEKLKKGLMQQLLTGQIRVKI